MTNATRTVRNARKVATVETVEALPVVLTATLTPSLAIADDTDANLRSAMSATIDGIFGAATLVAKLVDCIRASRIAGKSEDHIGRQMQLGAIMGKASVDLATATNMLDASPRAEETKKILDAQKMAKCRAYAAIKKADAPKPDADAPDAPKVDAPKGKRNAKLLDKIDIPAPVNSDALAAQLLKVRTMLRTIAKQGAGLDGAEDMIRAAKAAAATLAIVED